MKNVVVEFDPNVPVFSTQGLYSRHALDKAQSPGKRPVIPNWHLVDGCIKMTYWHAIKYYSNVLIAAHMYDRPRTPFGEAKAFVEQYFDFRNARIELSLLYLLGAYPPFIEGLKEFPTKRPFQLVRNRTSECPQPPVVKVSPIKPYVIPDANAVLKKAWLTEVMLGEPEPFFDYLFEFCVELKEGLEGLRDRMSKGEGKLTHHLEPIFAHGKMMSDDLIAWLTKNDPNA